jgi:hypothetical protein
VVADDAEVHAGFTQAVEEWQQQVVATQGGSSYDRNDLNKALAQSMTIR